MAEYNIFNEKEIGSWSFSEIGTNYINLCKIMINNPEWLSKNMFEKVEEGIKNRSLRDQLRLLDYFEFKRLAYKYSNEPENEKLFSKIEKHYYDNILYNSTNK